MFKVSASLEHACLQSLTKVLEVLKVLKVVAMQPLPQVSEDGHSRTSPFLCDAPRLLMAYFRLHFVYETAKL